jgi:hypothetical protein
MQGLTAKELVEHPAYKQGLQWKLPKNLEGVAEVAHGRAGGPFKLSWEIHGKGSTRIVVSAEATLLRIETFDRMLIEAVIVGDGSRCLSNSVEAPVTLLRSHARPVLVIGVR